MIIGIDEVGRGPLAGPVVACACFIPEAAQQNALYETIKDSKKLSATRREAICAWLKTDAVFAIGEASVAEIDTLNILQATFLAMERAHNALLASLPAAQKYAVKIDGNRVPKSLPHAQCVIGGDASVKEIAAASIIAKVHRDAIMQRLALDHPHYGWHSNAGYGAKIHMDAIRIHGVTEHHRRSFAPVRDALAPAS